MTADRFGPIPAGEYTALASARGPADAGLGPAAGMSPDRGPAPIPPYSLADQPPAPPPPAAATTASGAARAGADRATASPRRPEHRWLPVIPPQHGAWAFLIVPVLCAFAVSGASPAGWLFLVAWVCAYPVGYYGGRALTARARRGSWTRLARRELSRSVPWLVVTAALGLPLAVSRPWLLLAAALLAALWALGLAVAARRGERSMANDLLLVAQAVAAVPLTVAVVAGPSEVAGGLAGPTLTCTVIVAGYLLGSVIHVKSLLREAGNASFRRLNLAWHAGALVAASLASPWWAVGFAPALVRAVALRPGLRPGAIGGVEAIVSVLMVAAAFLAL